MISQFDNLDELLHADKLKESVFKKTVFSILYIWMYQYVHLNYLSEVWSYMRYFKDNLDFFQLLSMYIFALLPIYFYTGLSKISSYFSIIIYLMAYIPIIVTLSYNNSDELGYQSVFIYQFLLSLSMLSFFCVDKIKRVTLKDKNYKISIFWFHLFAIVVTLYLIYKFSGKMRFVGFDDVYSLRSEYTEIAEPISNYFTMWATYLIYPVYFCMGLINKNKKYLLIGILGHIIVYMIIGAKASVLMPLIIYLIYIAITKINFFSFFQSLAFFISFLSLMLFWIDVDALFTIRSLFLMRTLSMPGYLFSNYLSFFSNHPHTNYSHIGIVNALTNSYPYGSDPLGVVIGNYDNTGANANANFWATDGVAADGLFGIIIITIIMMFFFFIVNNLLDHKKSLFTFLAFTGCILSLLNVSFFTTLLSGGLLLLVLSLYLIDFEGNSNKINTSNDKFDS